MNTKEILNSYQEKKAKQKRFWSILVFVIVVFIVINLVLHFVLFPVKQNSVSMLPDIPKESVIMTSPLSKNYHRGDVVLMNARKVQNETFFEKFSNLCISFFTGQQIFTNESTAVPGTKQKIRRVVGLPGDTIYMRDYVLYIKPQGEKHFLTEFEIADKEYNVTFYVAPAGWDSSIGAKGSFDEITLNENQYFVLADNRKASDDSRLWGPVTKEDISSKALYIHIPFCISKCKYCDFFSIPCGADSPYVPESYVKALCNEIIFRINQFNIKKIETVYIGGGTPSLLEKNQLHEIFTVLKENLELENNCEITIESNPDDITKELLQIWAEEGINRISLGVQSFNDKALSYVSRRASSEVNKHALNIIKENWKKDLSVDFICGLPVQSSESFIEDLNYITKYRPDHISMYSLTIEEETPLGKEYLRGQLKYNFEFADDLWLAGKDILEKSGYIHYEVSNFCLESKQCRHNLKYWNHESYGGFGSGGAGTIYNNDGSGVRWTNIQNIEKYTCFWNNIKSFNKLNIPEVKEDISVETSMFEFFMMGLRKLSGVKESDFLKIFGRKMPERILASFEKWFEKGLCQITEENGSNVYTLGSKGILYLNCFLEEII